MKIGLTFAGAKNARGVLDAAGRDIVEKYREEIVNAGIEISKRAKYYLEEASKSRTGKKYWTGTLQEAIVADPIQREGNILGSRVNVGVTVRVDKRKLPTPAYDEWVEIGHYRAVGDFWGTRGAWWQGYHYMESAYAEMAPKIPRNIEAKLKIELSNFDLRGKGFAHRTTGRFVKGSAGFNVID